MDSNFNETTILVIDDSDFIRNSLKNFLSDYELDVITCSDGLEGIQKAIEHKPKLIFLDLMMPNLDGIRMLRVIKILDDLKDLPVIVISGHTDKNNVISALQAGAIKVISKPLNKEILVKSINEIFGKDFLKEIKKLKRLSSAEKEEVNGQLRKYFLSNLSARQDTIVNSIKTKNAELLKTVVHELKGTGAMVGYNGISVYCREIEMMFDTPKPDWEIIGKRCFMLINEFQTINQQANSEK